MSWVYVLWSDKLRKRYVGSTGKDPVNRQKEHNRGKTRSTKGEIPWRIIHTEHFESLSEARKREMFLKAGAGRKWLDENIVF